MDFKPAGLVIALITAWVCTGELACLSEVGPVVGEQGTEGDEGLLTSWEEKHTLVFLIFIQVGKYGPEFILLVLFTYGPLCFKRM